MSGPQDHTVAEILIFATMLVALLLGAVVTLLTRQRHTEEMQAQKLAMQEVMTGELNHRIRNLISTVLSQAYQGQLHTMRHHQLTPCCKAILNETFEDFEKRMIALGASHAILGKSNNGKADLQDIVEATLFGFGEQNRFFIAGPALELKAECIVSLNMVLHELATNATKYGALSVPAGTVMLTWEVDDHNRLIMDWVEENGPVVTAPSRKGFGTQLVGGLAMKHVKGSAMIAYEPSGVTCRIELPL